MLNFDVLKMMNFLFKMMNLVSSLGAVRVIMSRLEMRRTILRLRSGSFTTTLRTGAARRQGLQKHLGWKRGVR